MNYVDIKGNPISIGSRKSHAPKKKTTTKGEKEKRHMGFAATGFSPESLAEAEVRHNEAVSRGDASGPFDPEAFMNGHKPQKARSAPYSIPEAASQCAEMLRKAGWLRVVVVEIIR